MPPGHGTITSWSHRPRSIPGAQLALRVYRKVTTGDPPTLMVVGTSLQGRGGGSIDRDSFTHGSSAQRSEWLGRGQGSGEPADCNTFG